MTHEFRLPDIGEGLTEAEIVRWLIAEGEFVGADQPVVEVETDKAVVEIPSPYSGVLLKHGAAEGETIEVGAVLLVVGDEEESIPVPPTGPGEVEPADDRSPTVDDGRGPRETTRSASPSAAPIVGTLDEEAEDLGGGGTAGGAGVETQVKALPLVRKLAREMGVDLSRVTPTGPDGRVTRDDLMNAIELAEHAAPETVSAVQSGDDGPEPVLTPEPATEPEMEPEPVPEMEPEPVPAMERVSAPEQPRGAETSTGAVDERVTMTRLRRTIAANMSRSWAEIPHVTTFDEVDATRLLEVRQALGTRHDVKIPIDALVVKAVLPVLMEFPEFNSTIDGDELVVHGSLDIGIAVDTPDGLFVAVIRDAGSMSVLQLSAEVARLGAGARNRSLRPDELSGQSFTVSNIGAIGGGHGTPIVPYGTTAILSVGRAQQKPLVVNGDLVIAPLMPLSLSYDHRVIDGGTGRRFIARVIENLEEPALFLAG